jgi:hypothetical protein
MSAAQSEALSTIAAGADASTITVLGRYPYYVNLAEQLGADYFQVDPAEWDAMSAEEQWAANRNFLDQAIARGDNFLLSTGLNSARSGTWFLREIRYLMYQGYTFDSTGYWMIKL